MPVTHERATQVPNDSSWEGSSVQHDPMDPGVDGEALEPDGCIWVRGVDYVAGWRNSVDAAPARPPPGDQPGRMTYGQSRRRSSHRPARLRRAARADPMLRHRTLCIRLRQHLPGRVPRSSRRGHEAPLRVRCVGISEQAEAAGHIDIAERDAPPRGGASRSSRPPSSCRCTSCGRSGSPPAAAIWRRSSPGPGFMERHPGLRVQPLLVRRHPHRQLQPADSRR